MNNTDTLSITSIRRFARDHKGLAHTVCTAQAFAELERERVDAYTRPIFDRYTFLCERTGKRITDPDRLYLTDLDGANYLDYLEAVYDAHAAHGWEGPRDHCPALVAESLHTDAENCLLQAFADFIGASTASFYGDTRKRALDLLLRACLNA